ncbi:MAG: MBL fold metallo-hydrolase [Candidatus Thorarchaeota archaeon]|jgi:glyoxylase-like metal-dependent hydrolase (beta-lactamase superfamily II)
MSEDYPVHTEIAPKVHLVRGNNRARFPEANCLLIDDKPLTLVDAGASMENISRTLSDQDHKITDIEQVILTHFHVDHKGHAAAIQKQSNCSIVCHPLAKKGVETLEGTVEFYGINGHRFYERWRDLIAQRLPYVIADYEVTSTFKDNETIMIGDTQLIPVHTPGHTQDHTVFGINGLETLLLVDIDLTRFGPWYGNAVSNLADFRDSISKIINFAPETGISSHLLDPVTENLIQRLQNYLSIFETREQKIIESVKDGLNTIEKLAAAPTIYPRIPYDAYLIFEEFMLLKHVEDMIEKDMISYDGETISLK